MRYQVMLDDEHLLYDSLDNEQLDNEHILENPVLDLTVSKVGKFSFSIYPEHPHFNKLEKKSSIISVLKDKETIFRGRIIEENQGLWNNKNIVCESVLAYLNDSIVRPGTFSGSPIDFLTMIIVNHNSQVSEKQQLQLGNVTVEDPNNYISRSWSDYINSWQVLEKRGLELVGGYLVERYEKDGTYIDWLEDFNDTSTQIIEFGENIIDLFAGNNASKTYSVCIPLGAEIESDSETKTRLTIASVNDGKDYLINQAAYNKYGWIVAPVSETTFDDVTIASNLKTKGQAWLDNQGVMIESEFEITALDLEATDSDIESFFINEYVRIKSSYHNIDTILLLSSISIPLLAPENTKITLGESGNTLTGIELGNKQNIDDAIDRVGSVEKQYKINDKKLNDLESAIEYFSVDLSQYSIVIPTDNTKKPLETKNYDVNFYGYYKGKQVKPTVTIAGENTGITANKADSYIRFATSKDTAIPNDLNEYKITFNYTADGTNYTLTKVVDIALAIKGADGTSGTPGTDGKSAYQIWLEAGNTGTEEEYLESLKGTDGENGKDGADGKSSYTHIRYSANSNGNPMTTTPDATTQYLGTAVTNSPTAPTNYGSYTWVKIKGEQGIQGPAGADGKSTYFYVRYSANANGNPMTTTPDENTKYMGVASTTSSTAPTSYSAYTWTSIKGADGNNGSPGAAGADGKSSYLHIKYSDDGSTFTANDGETPGRYRGELVDFVEEDSTVFDEYTWYDMGLIVADELNSIREEVQTNITAIEQNQEEILMTALSDYTSKSEFEEYQETVSTEFSQTAEDFTFNFNNLTSQINKVEGDTQQQFQEQQKYIRFEDGKIILGETGNELTLVQQKDRISFVQNNTEVAFFSNNKLTVTDGDFLNSLKIGNFAFKPRANGNLSLVYVGGDTVG